MPPDAEGVSVPTKLTMTLGHERGAIAILRTCKNTSYSGWNLSTLAPSETV